MHATDRISLRTTPHTKAIIEQASQLIGVSMSHFILTTMYEKSLKLINDTPSWSLSQADAKRIQALLNDPTPPNAEMQALLSLTEQIEDRT